MAGYEGARACADASRAPHTAGAHASKLRLMEIPDAVCRGIAIVACGVWPSRTATRAVCGAGPAGVCAQQTRALKEDLGPVILPLWWWRGRLYDLYLFPVACVSRVRLGGGSGHKEMRRCWNGMARVNSLLLVGSEFEAEEGNHI